MSEHKFQMRLSCTYEEPKNSIAGIDVEVLTADGWQALELNERSPGFLIFVYAIFNCQHMYMRLNCAERDLVLVSADGSIEVIANADWVVRRMHIRLDGRLKRGNPTAEDYAYIVERMEHCPVSSNLKAVADSKTEISLG